MGTEPAALLALALALAPPPAPAPARPLGRGSIEPVSADHWQWRIGLTAERKAKLDRLRGMLGHAIPDGDLEKLFDQILAVRRAVLKRDGYRCTWVGPNGEPCPCTTQLEMDHLEPAAATGSSGVDDLTTRCRVHNQYRARLR